MSDTPEKKVSGLRVVIDRGTCIGTGACVNAAPEVFRLDDRQTVTFTDAPPDIDQERLVDACQFCPVDALQAFDADGKQLAP